MIRLENVSYSYAEGQTGSLHNITLHIRKGECILLCGASGCGKTTLTRLINGLIPHFFPGKLSGEIRVDGRNTITTEIAALSDIVGTVFQNPRTQFFNTDTDSELVFGLENRSVPREQMKERLRELTEDLHLEHLRGRSIFALSGGEKQKIAFSSVCASDPKILVLDEPSSNLDTVAIEELAELIAKAKSEGKTIIISEHRLWYLMNLADRVVFLRDGVLEKDFPTADFCSLPSDEIEAMGLRCRDLKEIIVRESPVSLTENYLDVKNLRVHLGKECILKDLSFSARGGEIIAIVGANGAGKTTLARALCGLQKESSGSITLGGERLSSKKRKQCSYMVMQDVGQQLFTDSIWEECRLGIQKPDTAQIEYALNLLGLSQYKDRHPLSLSGGQKQRLAVAVSLICKRKLLVFDEPTSGLDLSGMKEVGRLAKELSLHGSILLIVTHDVEFMKDICSRILVLSEGKITADLSGGARETVEQILRGEI